ncbi:27763_t:CDS:2 [Dentiscutata erythropus]|uniref:27763_t:CDS:1 n=1 Tax=Dentiscutata erythropus TaxID=1348616 RepID=A0A9N9IFD1_9GLOM|nr:27763_t:CDS:2 [Dentiscutata erythropus]
MSDQIVNRGLLINKGGIQPANLPICDFEIQPETIEDARVKLMFTTKHIDSFLLKNHIDPSIINYEDDYWISDIGFAGDESSLTEKLSVYMGILFLRKRLIFDNKKIKPSDELNNEMKLALKQNNPYHEVVEVFKDYGYFLPKKVILGHKLYSMTNLIAREDSPEQHFLESELKAFSDFAKLERNYILNQCFDTSFLTSINGENVMRDELKDWVLSCLKNDISSLQIISWEQLYPLYEIFDEPLKKEIKFILGSDELTKEFGVKERVLIAGEFPIKASTDYYCVNYPSHLNSAIIKSLENSTNTRNIHILALNSCSSVHDKISLKVPKNLPTSSIMCTNLTYLLSDKKKITANIQNYYNNRVNILINEDFEQDVKQSGYDVEIENDEFIHIDDYESKISRENQEVRYLLQWCIIFLPENLQTNIKSDTNDTIICLNTIGQPIYTTFKEENEAQRPVILNNKILSTKRVSGVTNIEWIRRMIKDGHIYCIDHEEFGKSTYVGFGCSGVITKTQWKKRNITIILKQIVPNDMLSESVSEELTKEIKAFLSVQYSSTKYADLGNLQDYLVQNNTLEWKQKINISRQVTRGLYFLHKNEILHRDLHIRNIVVKGDEDYEYGIRILIADFGLSKVVSRQTFNATYGMEYNYSSDIYSLGTIMWVISNNELFTTKYITNSLRERPVPGSTQSYVELYTKCLDDNPENRPNIENVYKSIHEEDIISGKLWEETE